MQRTRCSSKEALEHREPRWKLIPSAGVFCWGTMDPSHVNITSTGCYITCYAEPKPNKSEMLYNMLCVDFLTIFHISRLVNVTCYTARLLLRILILTLKTRSRRDKRVLRSGSGFGARIIPFVVRGFHPLGPPGNYQSQRRIVHV